jgi:nucleoid DNA-binding protein
MNKAELIDAIAAQVEGSTKKQVDEILTTPRSKDTGILRTGLTARISGFQALPFG